MYLTPANGKDVNIAFLQTCIIEFEICLLTEYKTFPVNFGVSTSNNLRFSNKNSDIINIE